MKKFIICLLLIGVAAFAGCAPATNPMNQTGDHERNNGYTGTDRITNVPNNSFNNIIPGGR